MQANASYKCKVPERNARTSTASRCKVLVAVAVRWLVRVDVATKRNDTSSAGTTQRINNRQRSDEQLRESQARSLRSSQLVALAPDPQVVCTRTGKQRDTSFDRPWVISATMLLDEDPATVRPESGRDGSPLMCDSSSNTRSATSTFTPTRARWVGSTTRCRRSSRRETCGCARPSRR